MIVDQAGDDGHYAASDASVKLSGSGAECVLGYERGIADHYLQGAGWIRGPHATVLGAKRAGASARAGISAGSGSQVREKEMFPQWHLPWISTPVISVVAALNDLSSGARDTNRTPTPLLTNHSRFFASARMMGWTPPALFLRHHRARLSHWVASAKRTEGVRYEYYNRCR